MKVIQVEDKIFVDVNKREALGLIRSLTNQMIADNPNVGRAETFTENGEYFSVFVTEENEREGYANEWY